MDTFARAERALMEENVMTDKDLIIQSVDVST